MANDSIYLMSGKELVEMSNQPYESEDLLQELLAKHPDLLAGSQMNADVPRRWLLVRRELGVPGGEGRRVGSASTTCSSTKTPSPHSLRSSAPPPPACVVKSWARCSTTRRNGSRYWPSDSLEAEFKARCAVDGLDSESLLAEHLAGDDADTFWATVGENIRSGRLRMVFVADVIPSELQRIIEFLNEQTIRTEVLGVEVRQYVGQGHQTLVPRVVGQTISEQQTKVASPKKSYAQLLANAAPETRTAEQLLRQWAEQHGLTVRQSPAALQLLTVDGAWTRSPKSSALIQTAAQPGRTPFGYG